jgi:hypothetical protein
VPCSIAKRSPGAAGDTTCHCVIAVSQPASGQA